MTVFEPLTDGTLIDYSALKVGAPAGDLRIIKCAKCGLPGLPHGRRCLHVVRVAQSPSGKWKQSVSKACSGGNPKPTPEPVRQTGLPWCPKDML